MNFQADLETEGMIEEASAIPPRISSQKRGGGASGGEKTRSDAGLL